MTLKHRSLGAIVLLSALVLAACGGAASTASSSAGSAQPSTASSAAASASAAASPASSAASASASTASAASSPAGSASAAASGATKTFKVGVIESFTGPLANNSKDNSDGYKLYLASVHNVVNGFKVVPTFVDDNNQSDQTLLKAKQLVESDKVQMLMGVHNTPGCYAVAQYVKQAHVPLAVTGNCGANSLTTGAKYASPYVTRFTQNTTGIVDPTADWAYRQGYRKAILMTSDYGGGLEVGDAFASVFVSRGGSIVQELHPPLGNADFGPYIAQLTKNADVLAIFMPGIDSLRFTQQYANYAGAHKPQVLDIFGQATEGQNLKQEGTKAVGFVGEYAYTGGINNPENKAFVKAWQAKYPGRPVSGDAAQGYSGAQVLVSALKKVNGQGNLSQQLLNALYSTNLVTAKGSQKLDSTHDIVQNDYFFKIVKQGNGITDQIVTVYPNVSRNWDRTEAQLASFKLGSHKGQWVGMTKAKLGNVVGTPQTSPSSAASGSSASPQAS